MSQLHGPKGFTIWTRNLRYKWNELHVFETEYDLYDNLSQLHGLLGFYHGNKKFSKYIDWIIRNSVSYFTTTYHNYMVFRGLTVGTKNLPNTQTELFETDDCLADPERSCQR